MRATLDNSGRLIPSEHSPEQAEQQPKCVTCGSDEHTTIDCPHYTDEDREMLLIGAELFVNGFTELGEHGQDCLNDFAAALQPNKPDKEPECAYCGEPLNSVQACSSPIGDVHDSCYHTLEATGDEQF